MYPPEGTSVSTREYILSYNFHYIYHLILLLHINSYPDGAPVHPGAKPPLKQEMSGISGNERDICISNIHIHLGSFYFYTKNIIFFKETQHIFLFNNIKKSSFVERKSFHITNHKNIHIYYLFLLFFKKYSFVERKSFHITNNKNIHIYYFSLLFSKKCWFVQRK